MEINYYGKNIKTLPVSSKSVTPETGRLSKLLR